MTLRHEPDVSHADWFMHADEDWAVLARQGPPGFDAYAMVQFADGEVETSRSDDEVMANVVALAAAHTSTPEDLFFGLWDGWGELCDSGRVYTTLRSSWLRDLWLRPTPPRTRPAFGHEVMDGAKVDLDGYRQYLLFRGRAADVGRWGADPWAPDLERALPPASVTWPADRAWFIAADVDPDWLCIGGSRQLIDAVLAHPDLDAEPATYGVIATTSEDL